ncbi:uncharacterized protein LOC143021873 isoform X2 [Oratosquilla oratoria]|uniref:uncharacterized protein LOC143021873 isoform X2 n=1 Tax=Oratosquilla oratoria TaxID=337810 RepID=UPI003F765D93
MVRKYQSKTDRARADGNLMERAVDEVVKGKSIREVSRLLDVNRITLSRYVKKFQAGQAKKTKDYAPKYNTRQVFTEEEEDGLAEYIVTCSQLLHGLGLTAVRRLAFDYAMKKDKTCPDSWKHNCMAGKDWMAGFMKRHCKITLHLPESTSVASVQAFNKQSVGEFFDIWTKTQAEKMFGPESVYNLDETGITTVQNVPKILATREQKQIGQTAAAERGTLITVCCCVNAVGRSLPPAMIFPRVHFKDFMTKGSPTGTLGLATQSEWMNSDLFPLVLQHFIKHMGCSTEKPAVLFMDNHESHLSLEVMEMARKHGLSIITFPPHTSHKLQPLDVSVYGPLKTHYKQAVNDWNLSSPGKRITIYDLPECFTKAYHRALSVENILAGFKKTGIWPIDTQIFSDNDFLAASVFMSRPNIDNVVNNGGDVVNPQGDLNLPSTSTASTMSTNKDSCQEEGLDHQTSFEEWTDLRKPSNQSSNQASKRKIAGAKKITSTPEKNLALMKMEEKLQKLRKTQKRLVVEDESSDEEVENTSIHGESSEYEEDFAADQTEEQSMKEECDSDNNDSSTIANENDLAGLMKEEENFEEELTIKEEPLDDREIDIRTIRKRKKRKLNSSIGRSEPKQKPSARMFYRRASSNVAVVPTNLAISDDESQEEDDDDVADPTFIPPPHDEDMPGPSEESPSSSKRNCMRHTMQVVEDDDKEVEEEGDSDEEDADQPQAKNGCKKKKPRPTIWKKVDIHNPPLPEYEHTLPDVIETPFQYFSKYFSSQFIDHITYQTNLYATQKDINTTFKTTSDEVMNFRSILIYMGIVELPAVSDYWAMETRIPQVADLMSSKRFMLMKRLVHFNDNSHIHGSIDRFYKVRPLFSFLNTSFRSEPQTPKQSVDEVMVAYKGKTAGNLRKYLKSKPDKWGFKIFCRASEDGFIHDMMLYQGRTTLQAHDIPLTPEQEVMGVTSQIVAVLASTISCSTTTAIFADNYFTSLEIVRYLKDKDCRYTGTARETRIWKPPLKTVKEMEKKMSLVVP